MRGWGVALMIIGALLIFAALVTTTAVDSGGALGGVAAVQNIGLLEQQVLTAMLGLGSFMSGVMLLVGGVLADRLRPPVVPPSPIVAEPKDDWTGRRG